MAKRNFVSVTVFFAMLVSNSKMIEDKTNGDGLLRSRVV
jgi:hypothetical protein